MLMERGHLQDGDHVALVYPPGEGAGLTPWVAEWSAWVVADHHNHPVGYQQGLFVSGYPHLLRDSATCYPPVRGLNEEMLAKKFCV